MEQLDGVGGHAGCPGARWGRRFSAPAIAERRQRLERFAQDFETRERDAELDVDFDEELERRERVTAEVEEVVVEPDLVDTERALPELGEPSLRGSLGLAQAQRVLDRPVDERRLGERLAID